MQLGFVGLGRMGSGMVRRLLAGHECVVHDTDAAAMAALAREGAATAETLDNLVSQLSVPRIVWLMLPAAVVEQTIAKLAPLLDRNDILIDGGNSYYHDDLRRAEQLQGLGIHYVDVGTSGGVFGLARGYCMMIGGAEAVVKALDPIFKALCLGEVSGAVGVPVTPGRAAKGSSAESGYLRCGQHGAGHFVKMIHNGIEYGMMAAMAEGLNILRNANVGANRQHADAETTPLRNPEHYQYNFNLPEITEVWRRGSVISSWLLDLTAAALQTDPQLSNYAGRVSDSGEGRWSVIAAVDEAVPAPVLTAALYARFSSREGDDFANRVLSAMRHQFGGHVEKLIPTASGACSSWAQKYLSHRDPMPLFSSARPAI